MNSSGKYLTRIISTVGIAVLVSGCSSSGDANDPAATSASTPAITALDGRALDLLAAVDGTLDCTVMTGPMDELQSMTEVGHIACGQDATEHIYTFDDPRGMRYEIQSLDTGAPGGRGFLVGADWLIVSDSANLPALQSEVGGDPYTGTEEALAHVSGFSDTDQYVTCELFYSSALVSYVSTGQDPIPDLDRVTIPGISNIYDQHLRSVIPQLASFRQGDDEAARSDLLPYANDIRDACHELYPS